MTSTIDRALASAFNAWSGRDREAILARLSPKLRAAAETESIETRDASYSFLTDEHSAEIRFDPARVHPTWWVRALADESEAVKRVVARRATPAIAQAVRLAFGLDNASIEPEFPPHPSAERYALSLWPERLVGGHPPRDDDPLVVRAIARAEPHTLKNLVRLIAFAKRSYDPTSDDLSAELRREYWPVQDNRFIEYSRRDVTEQTGIVDNNFPTLGLLTLGRLLEAVEPFRARWCVQHLPYPVAKVVRSQRFTAMNSTLRHDLIEWELSILRVAMEMEAGSS